MLKNYWMRLSRISELKYLDRDHHTGRADNGDQGLGIGGPKMYGNLVHPHRSYEIDF